MRLSSLETLRNNSPESIVELSYHRPMGVGAAALFLLISGLGIWSVTVPLASATLAIGTVVVETDRKLVQHVEGGTITKLHVRDGDLVQAGQPLIDLDDTRPRASIATLTPLLSMNVAQLQRLDAERADAEAITTNLTDADLADPDYSKFREEQRINFEARKNGLKARIQAQGNEHNQQLAAIAGLRKQLTMCEFRSNLDQQDLTVALDLAARGYGTRQKVRETQRHLAVDSGECANYHYRIVEAAHRLNQTEKEIEKVRANFAESVESERQSASKERIDLLYKYRSASDQLSRSRIVAPARGYIVNMIVHTEGGVIAPGQPLLEIVPDLDRLVVEAQISPSEAQTVKPGQVVRIRLVGDDGKDAPLATGSVQSVSADRIYDRQRSAAFFLVRVTVEPGEVLRVRGHHLSPGMSVELMIEKGHRTLLNYLLSPMFSFFASALRE